MFTSKEFAISGKSLKAYSCNHQETKRGSLLIQFKDLQKGGNYLAERQYRMEEKQRIHLIIIL